MNARRGECLERIRLLAALDMRRSGPGGLVTPSNGRACRKIRWIIIPQRPPTRISRRRARHAVRDQDRSTQCASENVSVRREEARRHAANAARERPRETHGSPKAQPRTPRAQALRQVERRRPQTELNFKFYRQATNKIV